MCKYVYTQTVELTAEQFSLESLDKFTQKSTTRRDIKHAQHAPSAKVNTVGKQQKAKSGQTRNDNRKNGKAFKNPDGARNQRNPQSEVQKVLLGKGMYQSRKESPLPTGPRRTPRDSDD